MSSSTSATTTETTSGTGTGTGTAGPPPSHSTVLVTGANGFLATHIVEQLLDAGFSVRGTVRPSTLANEAKIAHLHALAAAAAAAGGSASLELVPAELDDIAALTDAAQGTHAVLHTASPYALNVDDPVEELLRPAVVGTVSTLVAATAAGVSRVVLTSSMAAVTDSPDSDHVYTEADWNVTSTVKRSPYYASKALAEKAAWSFVGAAEGIPELPCDGLVELDPSVELPDPADVPFDLVVVNPFIIVGREPSPSVNTSNGMLRDIMDKKYPAIMDLSWCFVAVEDVARAHILALTSPDAHGRYLCALDAISMRDTVDILRSKYPDHPLPTRNMACKGGTFITKLASRFQPRDTGMYLRTNLGKVCHIDNSKVKALGLSFTPVEDTIIRAVEDLRLADKLNVPVTTVADSATSSSSTAADTTTDTTTDTAADTATSRSSDSDE